jgi:hypothetical protein
MHSFFLENHKQNQLLPLLQDGHIGLQHAGEPEEPKLKRGPALVTVSININSSTNQERARPPESLREQTNKPNGNNMRRSKSRLVVYCEAVAAQHICISPLTCTTARTFATRDRDLQSTIPYNEAKAACAEAALCQ